MNNSDGAMTSVLHAFLRAFGMGFGYLAPTAHWLLASLIVLDLTIWGLWYALGGEGPALSQFLRKVFLATGLIGLVSAWPKATQILVNGFVWLGRTAGGGTGPLITDPSGIANWGWEAAAPIRAAIRALATGPIAYVEHIGKIDFYMLAVALTLAAFFIIALQCFVAYLEFALTSVLTLIFIPFAAWKHTRFLGEKAFGAMISHGIKLMVLTFIIAVAGPVFTQLVPPANPTLGQAFDTALAALAIMLLAISAPKLSAGLLSGAPSLGAGAVLGAAAGAGATVALAATGVGAAGALAKAGTGAAAKAAGALHEGAMGGLKDMTTGGGATLSEKAAGLAVGAGSVAAGAAARKVASPADYLRQKFNEGRLATFNRAAGGSGGTPPAAPPGGPAPAGSGSPPSSTSTGGAAIGAPGANSTTPKGGQPSTAHRLVQHAQAAAHEAGQGDAGGAGVQPSLPAD